MNFDKLIQQINLIHTQLQQNTIKAININLTIRNWLIGFYIVEFEQNGKDYAKYGEKLLKKLSASLIKINISTVQIRELRRYRTFYKLYKHFAILFKSDNLPIQIRGTLSPESNFQIRGTVSPELQHADIKVSAEKIINKLSFSHFAELIEIEDNLKRIFYEIKCIKNSWSVRELKKQINRLYFERSGLSKKPEKFSEMVQSNAEINQTSEIIKSPFVFEFLGLKAKDTVYENDIEQALIENLQDFLTELGNGFCFEDRQKKILIGDEYFFIDLVFYHRVLKCHVIIELKNDAFKYEHIAQLKVYLQHYKKNVQLQDDNPPVGLLLVTDKNNTLVEYAIADSDKNIFVSKYILELPKKEKFIQFVKNELKQL